MNTKLIYAIAGIILAVAAGIVAYSLKNRASQNSDSTPAQQQQQHQQQSQAPESNGQQSTGTSACAPADWTNKTAELQTTMGTIDIQLYDKDAPKTVENFVCLIKKGYYNGIKFHRVAHGFVIQAGDPTGTGSGGNSFFGGPFADELNPNAPSYKAGYLKGVVAMANAGPNTNTSQFFILLSDHPELPHNYTIFGKVIAGMNAVEKIGAVPVTPVLGPDDGAPKTPVIINKAVIK